MHVYLKDFDYNGSKVISIKILVFEISETVRQSERLANPENKTKCCTPIMHSKPNEHL